MRSKTLDIAKGIGIILVVVGHNWLVAREPSEMFRVIYSFHVPLFFFLSGIFFKVDIEFKDLVNQKFQSLLKPYFVVLMGVGFWDCFFKNGDLVNILFGILFATGQSISLIPVWFLPHLFIVMLCSWGILRLLNNGKNRVALAMVILSFMAVGGIFVNSVGLFLYDIFIADKVSYKNLMGLPFGVDLFLVSGFFFLLGFLLSEKLKNFQGSKFFFVISFILFVACHYFYDQTMDLNKRIYGNPLISTIQAVTGIYGVIFLSNLLAQLPKVAEILSYIGSGSLFVLIFHGILQGKATHQFQSLFPLVKNIDALAGLVVAIALSLFIWEIVKRLPVASALLLPKEGLNNRPASPL